MQHKEDTKEKLLASARKEFLAAGFQKASLRRICKNAGLTTGALYFFFDDKNALFDALVKETADHIRQMLHEHVAYEEKEYGKGHILNESYDIEFGKDIMSYYYEHQEEGTLLIQCAQGSNYEHFADDIIEYMEHKFKLVINSLDPTLRPVFNECTLHWLSHVQVEAFLHVLSHDFPKEQAVRQIEIVVSFLRGGFSALLHMK